MVKLLAALSLVTAAMATPTVAHASDSLYCVQRINAPHKTGSVISAETSAECIGRYVTSVTVTSSLVYHTKHGWVVYARRRVTSPRSVFNQVRMQCQPRAHNKRWETRSTATVRFVGGHSLPLFSKRRYSIVACV